MEPLTEPMHTAWPFPFVPQDWEHVRDHRVPREQSSQNGG
jgi:hypothetical protein